jgi:enoyl-CoA hydratase/carnithine racemase
MAAACSDLALETMSLKQDGRVLTASFSGPRLHFANSAFIHDLDHLTKVVDEDSSVGAVVLTGVDGRFLTHADPAEIADVIEKPTPPLSMGAIEPGLRLLNAALRLPGLAAALERFGGAVGRGLIWGWRWKRTILRMNRSRSVYLAAINGPTLGGGHEIALACDLRYVSDGEHIRLGQFEILVGNIPGGGGTQRLPGMIGLARALEHMLEGAPLTAREAFDLGLVHRLVPDADLLAETQATAARLASRAPTAIGAIKRSVYFGTRRSLPRGLDMELAGFLATTMDGMAPGKIRALLDDIEQHGDTPFLADPDPWIEGTRTDPPT